MRTSLDSRPKLRDEVTILRRENRGRVYYVVKQPQEQKYYQFGELEVGLMRLMDGQRTPEQIAERAAETLGIRPPAGQIADFAHKLKRLGVVARTAAEQHLMLAERLRSERKVRAGRRTKGSVLRMRFSIGDPDSLFAWLVKRVPWFWSPGFIGLSLVLFVVYAAILVARRDAVWEGTVGLATLRGFGAWDWVLLYVLSISIVAVHELGHGLTTKYFGGEVHEIGGMLLYFSPALFCNTNDAWTFEKRSHRLWVTFAGPWIQLVIAGLAAIIWFSTETGTLINRLAFISVLVGGFLSVVTNFNPLIPLDGYYALSDWLEVPNLRRRAFGYWSWLSKRYVLGMDVAKPAVTPRERRIFLIYGGLAILYSAFAMAVSLLWLVKVLGRFMGPWIWLILVLILARTVYTSARRGATMARAAATSWRAGFLRGTRAALLVAAVILIIGLPFVLPWTVRVKGPFTVEGTPQVRVRAQVAGILDRWDVEEGDTISAGDAITTLWNPELLSRVRGYEARLERLRLDRSRAEATGARATAAATASALNELRSELADLRAQREQLVVRAPFDGVVLGQRLEERLGEALAEGDPLVEIAAAEGRRARIRLPLKEGGEVAPGQPVSLKLVARPDLEFRTTVHRVAPAAENGWLEADLILPGADWQPRPGMTGIAKIETRRGTVAAAIGLWLRRTIRVDLWL
jgi:putative peptide zinc metalloprotease protein